VQLIAVNKLIENSTLTNANTLLQGKCTGNAIPGEMSLKTLGNLLNSTYSRGSLLTLLLGLVHHPQMSGIFLSISSKHNSFIQRN
jgi:hypothetical protein